MLRIGGLWWYVKQSYKNWQYDDPSAFVDMYFHTDNIVSYFKEHIIRWTEIVSPVLDKVFSPGQVKMLLAELVTLEDRR